MDPGGARLLREAGNQFLHLLSCDHHQVGKFVDDDDDDRQRLERLRLAGVEGARILDQSGAEALLGAGDMLYLPPGTGLPQRVHGAFVADHEVHKVVEHLKGLAKPEYLGDVLEPAVGDETGVGVDGEGSGEKDALYDQAVEIVVRTRRPSISLVQRHLRIGYNRAARLIEDMERAGLVSPMQSNGNREVLVPARAE